MINCDQIFIIVVYSYYVLYKMPALEVLLLSEGMFLRQRMVLPC